MICSTTDAGRRAPRHGCERCDPWARRHISEDDARGGVDPYRTGMLRELTEEVQIGCEWKDTLLGFINDDRTPVGNVHLGVVHLVELGSRDVASREDALRTVHSPRSLSWQ
ncbi:MAG: hypothetical protein U0792_07830 [Gemmataceae bacterium]